MKKIMVIIPIILLVLNSVVCAKDLTINEHYKQGVEYEHNGEYKKAINSYSQVIKRDYTLDKNKRN